MEFFDRELPRSEEPSRRREYRLHVEGLGLPRRLRDLAHRDLRDSRLRRIVVDRRTRQVILFLRGQPGDSGHGARNGHGDGREDPRDFEILYHRVELDRLDAELLETRAADPETAILADELDRGEDGLFVHRLLFHPAGELELSFRDAACVERPTDGSGN